MLPITCQVDDGAEFDCTSDYTLDELAIGTHTFSVTATDAAGNDGSPATRTFKVSVPATAVPAPAAGRPPTIVLPSPAPAGRCGSKRNFTIRLRPKNRKLVSALVLVNGKRVKTSKGVGGRLKARVDLTGLAKGSYQVKITARGKNGRRYKETRTYKVC